MTEENETLGDTINKQIQFNIQQINHPTRCKITKIYEDNQHTDITTDIGDLEFVETIGSDLNVGNTGVLIFVDGYDDDFIVITK